MVPVRPPISRLPSTEKVTAGSVGASAAPRMPAAIQEKLKSQCAAIAISPAVAKVPTTPSETISSAEARKRRQPTCRPPSKRIMIRATTPIRSTSRIETCAASEGKRSDASAAASRKIAGRGNGKRLVSSLEASASEKPAATMSTTFPKSSSSLTAQLLGSVCAAGRRGLVRSNSASIRLSSRRSSPRSRP
jgi:hypothetical protein